MNKFVNGHVTKMWFLKLWITSLWTQILHLNFKENVEKDDVIKFTAHLSVTMKRWTRSKQELVLAALWEGKSMPSNMAANTNHTTLLKNQSATKYLP